MSLLTILFLACNILILIWVSGFIGGLSNFKGYVSLSQMGRENSLGFNVVFRILVPIIYFVLISILLEWACLSKLIKTAWLVVPLYYGFHFLAILLKRKFFLINAWAFFLSSALGIFFAYLIHTYLKSASALTLLPNFTDMKSELWLIVILFIYSMFNNQGISYAIDSARTKDMIEKRYLNHEKKFNAKLTEQFQKNKLLNDVFFSILIYEDINRPKFFRSIENILFRIGMSKTIGIMQTASKKLISDEESIKLAQEKILSIYSENSPSEGEYDLARRMITDYNKDAYYRDEVIDLFYKISEISERVRFSYWKDISLEEKSKDSDISSTARKVLSRVLTMSEEEYRALLKYLEEGVNESKYE